MSDNTPSQKRPALDAGTSERKRRRKVLSCIDCRRRKLQCDRASPACGRCTKAGRASECLYLDEPSQDTKAPNVLEDHGEIRQLSLATVADFKDRRIRELEATLASNGRASQTVFTPMPDASSTTKATTPHDRESMVLRGRAFKTKYFGSTNAGANIGCIPELRNITRESFNFHPALGQMRADVRALEDRIGKDADSWILDKNQDLKTVLPPRAETDELVRLYIDTFETIYHILHLPTFWRDYETLWSNADSTTSEFAATILLMMSCVACMSSGSQQHVAQSSVTRNKSLAWIRYTEEWLSRQGHQNVSAAHFQIGCLLWLAQACNERKVKQTWSEAGTLLRRCMSAGLHRDPDLLQKETSVLDKELRRRVWATAVEFELQSSFDHGMVSAPWSLQSDSPAPSNLHDDDLTSERLPAPRPKRDFTSASYLAISNESLILRSTLNAVLNNIRHSLTFDEVKHYTEEIESHLSAIPEWQDPRSELPKAMLNLRLRQYLIVLHDRQLRQATTAAERSFSKGVLLETSVQIVETHKDLMDKGNYTSQLFCLDPLRVVLSIVHLQMFLDPRTDLALSKMFQIIAPQLVEEMISMVQAKFFRFGRDGRQLWITISSQTLMRIREHPDRRQEYMQQAIDRIIHQMNKLLASQGTGSAVTSGSFTNGNGVVHLQTPSRPPQPASQAVDGLMLDFDGFDDWTFQDWFNTADFQEVYQPSQEEFG